MGCFNSTDNFHVIKKSKERENTKLNQSSKILKISNENMRNISLFLNFEEILVLLMVNKNFQSIILTRKIPLNLFLRLVYKNKLFKKTIFIEEITKDLKNTINITHITIDNILLAYAMKIRYSLLQNKHLKFRFNSVDCDEKNFEYFVRTCSHLDIYQMRKEYKMDLKLSFQCNFHRISKVLINKYQDFLFKFFDKVNLSKSYLSNDELVINQQIDSGKMKPNIKILNLSYNFLGPNSSAFIQDSLTILNNQLIKINLRSNKLGNEVIRIIYLIFKNDLMLQSLDIGDNDITSEGCKWIESLIIDNKTISEIWIGNNPINDQGFKIISSSLLKNNTIRLLDLSFLSITNFSSKSISTLFKYNTSILKLYLINNNLGEEEIPRLFEGFRNNSTLEYLNLSFNKIGCIGSMIISSALKTKVKLKIIDLQNNVINHTGAIELLNSLNFNRNIEKMYVANNLFTIMNNFKSDRFILDYNHDDYWKGRE